MKDKFGTKLNIGDEVFAEFTYKFEKCIIKGTTKKSLILIKPDGKECRKLDYKTVKMYNGFLIAPDTVEDNGNPINDQPIPETMLDAFGNPVQKDRIYGIKYADAGTTFIKGF